MPEHERGTNGWSRYEEMVLGELRQLREEVGCIDDRLDKVRTEDLPQLRVDLAGDMATAKAEMRFNSRLWALVAGAIPIILGVIYAFVGGHKP